ncbi:MAG: single-stranded DNA-binding protein [Bifidobacteriaceae bacterium]|jgi:single-strand DNA-binding protein|nr:single-stranded DNA-binding protein [Bifidobacteriaceae bacterium]
MNNDVQVTVRGWVGRAPEIQSNNGGEWTRFRLASTAWWKDRDGQTQSTQTEWFEVRLANSALAANVMRSVKKGDAVIVMGRLRTSSWQGQNQTQHWDMQIVAETVGHDLRYGRTQFDRVQYDRGPAQTQVGQSAQGAQGVQGAQGAPAVAEPGNGAIGALNRAMGQGEAAGQGEAEVAAEAAAPAELPPPPAPPATPMGGYDVPPAVAVDPFQAPPVPVSELQDELDALVDKELEPAAA